MAHDTARLRAEFDRIALLSVDHAEDDRCEDWFLRYLPLPCENALDIGCGTGSLARALAVRADHVLAIDLSPAMVRVASERSVHHPNIEFLLGDFLSLKLPGGRFDCITAVAVLHHMPWIRAVARAKELLRVGGTLLIIDLLEDDGLSDRFLSGVAWAVRCLGRRQPRELRDAWAEHGRGDSYLTMSEARRLCEQALPGARVRRHLFWRYSAIWNRAA